MKEEILSLRQKYQTVLTQLAPIGAVGVSLALGAAAPAAASEPPAGGQPPATVKEGVSERLAAVRDAVSAFDQLRADAAKAEGRLAWGNWGIGWGWGGYGYQFPNWNNWHDWHNWNNWWRNW
jgi:hypothetical protein